MMTHLTIVANIKASADKVDLVKAELLKLIDITRSEEGCINYDLHQDNDNPAHFMFYENWKTRELWQTHMANQHLADYETVLKASELYDDALASIAEAEKKITKESN